MKAIMVNRSETGCYEIPGAAEVEAWADVVAATERQTRLDSLFGWGEWRSVWVVEDEHGGRWYFVGTSDADAVAEILDYDGSQFSGAGGVDFRQLCRKHGATPTWRDGHCVGDVVRWDFPDGSAIVESGDAWDFSACDGFCLSAVGCDCEADNGDEHFVDDSIFVGCMRFTAPDGEYRAEDEGANWGVYRLEGGAFVRRGTVERCDNDAPRDVWERHESEAAE